MPTLSKLKEEAARLCPYPIEPWRDAKFGMFSAAPDSAFADCTGHKAVVSVIVRPPEGVPYIALLEGNRTIPLRDNGGGIPEQLSLL